MSDTILFAVGMAVFFAAHLFAAFRPRDLPERMGRNAYRGLFSLVSIVGLVLLIVGYAGVANLWPVWDPPLWTRHIPMLLMIPAMILFVAAELPIGRIKRAAKHPMLLGIKLWAAGHLAANGDLASILLFGGFLAYAVLDRIVVKRRPAPAIGAVSTRSDVIAVVAGLALYALIVFWAHRVVIGVPVLA